MKQNLLATKEFAYLCQTTKRTIIYYDQIGLLCPIKREGYNRYYSQRQVMKFEKIALLQSLGFSLKNIKQKIASHQNLKKIFEENKEVIAKKQRIINTQMQKINEILKNLENNNTILNPQIKQIPAYSYYGFEREGKYVDIPFFCKELAQLIDDKKTQFTYFVIFLDFYGIGYSPLNSKMFIAAKPTTKLRLKEKNKLKLFHASRSNVISALHRGSHASLAYVWESAWKYVQKNKFNVDLKLPPREIYLQGAHNQLDEENYITELQIPLKTHQVQ